MRRVLASVLACSIATAVVLPGPASAQDPSDVPTAPVEVPASVPGTIELADLGLPTTLTLSGVRAKRTVFLPVDEELRPTALRGVAAVSADVLGARVEFAAEGTQLGVVNLVGGAAPQPFEIALDAVTADRTEPLAVEITTLLPFADSFCRGQFTVPTVRLDQLRTLAQTGTAPPTTIADFLPAVLRTARIWVPPSGGPAITEGALRLATGLVHRYATAGLLEVQVGALEPGQLPIDAYAPTVRDFVFGGPDASDDLVVQPGPGGAPVLVLPGAAPGRAAAALFDGLAEAAVVDAAGVEGSPAGPVVPGREQRLIDLGAPATAATGTGEVTFDLFVPQAAFGSMTSSWKLRVSGRHTPEPDVLVSLLVNGVLVGTDHSDDDGRFSLTPTIREPVMARDNTLTLVVEQRNDDGPCSAGAHPIEVQLSDRATITADRGPSLPPGFLRTPQGLLPEVDVIVSDHGASTVSAAVGLAVELQRLSPPQIGTRVVERTTAGRPALVLSADGSVDLGRSVPVRPGTSPSLLDLDGRRLDLAVTVPLLQVAERGGAPMVVASAATGPDLASLVDAIRALPDRFRSLRGDVAVLVDGRFRFAQVREAAPPTTSDDDDDPPWGLIWAAATAGVVLGALLVAWLRRSRHRRRT